MSIVFPYEDFPLIGQMNFDSGESFYKKVVFASIGNCLVTLRHDDPIDIGFTAQDYMSRFGHRVAVLPANRYRKRLYAFKIIILFSR